MGGDVQLMLKFLQHSSEYYQDFVGYALLDSLCYLCYGVVGLALCLEMAVGTGVRYFHQILGNKEYSNH